MGYIAATTVPSKAAKKAQTINAGRTRMRPRSAVEVDETGVSGVPGDTSSEGDGFDTAEARRGCRSSAPRPLSPFRRIPSNGIGGGVLKSRYWRKIVLKSKPPSKIE